MRPTDSGLRYACSSIVITRYSLCTPKPEDSPLSNLYSFLKSDRVLAVILGAVDTHWSFTHKSENDPIAGIEGAYRARLGANPEQPCNDDGPNLDVYGTVRNEQLPAGLNLDPSELFRYPVIEIYPIR